MGDNTLEVGKWKVLSRHCHEPRESRKYLNVLLPVPTGSRKSSPLTRPARLGRRQGPCNVSFAGPQANNQESKETPTDTASATMNASNRSELFLSLQNIMLDHPLL